METVEYPGVTKGMEAGRRESYNEVAVPVAKLEKSLE